VGVGRGVEVGVGKGVAVGSGVTVGVGDGVGVGKGIAVGVGARVGVGTVSGVGLASEGVGVGPARRGSGVKGASTDGCGDWATIVPGVTVGCAGSGVGVKIDEITGVGTGIICVGWVAGPQPIRLRHARDGIPQNIKAQSLRKLIRLRRERTPVIFL
jgi:hypothetical protein